MGKVLHDARFNQRRVAAIGLARRDMYHWALILVVCFAASAFIPIVSGWLVEVFGRLYDLVH